MESYPVSIYRHSGKFPISAPVIAAIVGVCAAFPLGYLYSYLVNWIPFVYLNFFLTLGYGFAFGMIALFVLKGMKARNSLAAAVTGVIVGLIALYFEWNGHAHALLEDVPFMLFPDQLWAFIKVLNESGSWGLRSGGNVTGIPLTIVWIIEAGMIVGVAAFIAWSNVSDTPFCETTKRWLDDDRVLDTLAPFDDPADRAALKSGDLAPLLKAAPRTPPDAGTFVRITEKSAGGSETFRTVQFTSVTITRDNKGEASEATQNLTEHLILPPSMFGLVDKFASFSRAPTPGSPPENSAG